MIASLCATALRVSSEVHAGEVLGAVGSAEVSEHQTRRSGGGKSEQAHDFVGAGEIGGLDERIAARLPSGPTKVACGPRVPESSADPADRGRANALALGGLVQMLAAGEPIGVGVVIVGAALGIEEEVGDDAVVLGPAAGRDRRGADQRDGRERRLHVVRRGTFAPHAVEVRRLERIDHGGREAVEEQHHDRALRRLCRRTRERRLQAISSRTGIAMRSAFMAPILLARSGTTRAVSAALPPVAASLLRCASFRQLEAP